MTADLTREQAREQIARAIVDAICVDTFDGMGGCADPDDNCIQNRPWLAASMDGEVESVYMTLGVAANLALTVLWPVVEGLRAERDEARENAEDDERLIRRQGDLLTGVANALRGDPPPLVAWGHSALPDLAFRVKVSMEEARAEVDRLTAELAHAHTVIARHVEPRREGDK